MSTLKPIESMTRQELVDEIQPPPHDGCPFGLAATIKCDRSLMMKFAVARLRSKVEHKRKAAEETAKVRPIAEAISAEIFRETNLDPNKWRSTLVKFAKAHEVTMPPITTRSETTAILSQKIARSRIEQGSVARKEIFEPPIDAHGVRISKQAVMNNLIRPPLPIRTVAECLMRLKENTDLSGNEIALLVLIADAADEYLREFDNPGPDFHMRRARLNNLRAEVNKLPEVVR